MVTPLDKLRVKIFADGASLIEMAGSTPLIKGFTTNPSLMHKSGIKDYEEFGRAVTGLIRDKPISFEVFSDDREGMLNQAFRIAKWGPNVNVKIPITNTKGLSSLPVIRELTRARVPVNVTAVFTPDQVQAVAENAEGPTIVSVFAGRIADTGRRVQPLMAYMKRLLSANPHCQLLWASCRELFNIIEADEAECDIITVPYAMLKKTYLWNFDLSDYSRATVGEFYDDAQHAGYAL